MSELEKQVEALIKKAVESTDAIQAVHFSQAALNAAHTKQALADSKEN